MENKNKNITLMDPEQLQNSIEKSQNDRKTEAKPISQSHIIYTRGSLSWNEKQAENELKTT